MKMVELPMVFHMPEGNAFKTAFQLARGPSEYLIHLTDLSNGMMAMGFLSREELVKLRDALNKELAQ